MTLLKILAILFVVLLALVTVLEKFAKPATEESQARIAKMQRWIFPLIALSILLQIAMFYFF